MISFLIRFIFLFSLFFLLFFIFPQRHEIHFYGAHLRAVRDGEADAHIRAGGWEVERGDKQREVAAEAEG